MFYSSVPPWYALPEDAVYVPRSGMAANADGQSAFSWTRLSIVVCSSPDLVNKTLKTTRLCNEFDDVSITPALSHRILNPAPTLTVSHPAAFMNDHVFMCPRDHCEAYFTVNDLYEHCDDSRSHPFDEEYVPGGDNEPANMVPPVFNLNPYPRHKAWCQWYFFRRYGGSLIDGTSVRTLPPSPRRPSPAPRIYTLLVHTPHPPAHLNISRANSARSPGSIRSLGSNGLSVTGSPTGKTRYRKSLEKRCSTAPPKAHTSPPHQTALRQARSTQ